MIPMKAELAVVCIRVPRLLKDALDAEAARDERSISNTVVRILRQHLAQQQREAAQ
jgi:hypothetical protein